ncbi:SpoIVB peptidase [Fonticella tunisiensis]|uniref:SpoIVB peptidase n=1 Tax=Fonticella tunisiensis TaxID=1096341 RepID=A0A4R7KRC9_9CLOT|nr:SpoIVB peptidase [Fonticella tunisiensis]TDT61931.1 SpoIVB peptidase [Fonticella tunisiensis]
MKINKYRVLLSFLVALLIFLVFSTINVMSMPGNMNITDSNRELMSNENLKSNLLYKIDSDEKNYDEKSSYKLNKLHINVKLFGIIPIKKMTINFLPEIKVIPGGYPIGVKLHTDGILVVGFSDVETPSGREQSPAVKAGIEIGDCIIEVDGKRIESSKQLSDVISSNRNKVIDVKINRKGEVKKLQITPVATGNKNEYKIGLWVRDSTAGVGTLTFYDPVSGKFGALGHPINDVDTGKLLPIRDGKIYNAKIISVEQGARGKPGELRGIFSEDDEIGTLNKNTPAGIYGESDKILTRNSYNKPIPIARQSEIKEGPAKILTSIQGDEVKEYDIYIEKLTPQSRLNPKSMIIRVTDQRLIEKTGGIVQGMSGSPIIQDGKLVGAVTHVFVNKPDMGYGIYIEWMLKEAGFDI